MSDIQEFSNDSEDEQAAVFADHTTVVRALQTPGYHTGEPALPAAVASRPWGPSRPSRGHICPFFEHRFIAWMLNYCVKLILLYYYYSCYVFYYIVWLSLAIFGNIVNKEEICLLTAFVIN